jgi:hypothetical protein
VLIGGSDFVILATAAVRPGANENGSGAQASRVPREDTASMMLITREQVYKEGERMCVLNIFN